MICTNSHVYISACLKRVNKTALFIKVAFVVLNSVDSRWEGGGGLRRKPQNGWTLTSAFTQIFFLCAFVLTLKWYNAIIYNCLFQSSLTEAYSY